MPGEGIESQIKQIEKYIKDNKGLLEKEEASIYASSRRQCNQSHSKEKNKNYFRILGKLECVIRDKHHSKDINELRQNFKKIKKELKECSNGINEIKMENINNHRGVKKLSNDYKERQWTNTVFAISAVVLVALVCYVTFFHLTCPSCILDNAVVKQNVAALVNSAI
ncbi:hypothetical protein [Candidatus Mesenet endosymbiont of Phosphuga atrata]|uniref:hypothetical protein n=1 Tax=Candidatus Mesenet endosymbiont of Phosphuga atrata TaxID=3066221 RepID=UPI0030CBB2A8